MKTKTPEEIKQEELKKKRQLCWNKKDEKSQEIYKLNKQINAIGEADSDLEAICRFLTKKFGFDLEAEKAEICSEVTGLKRKISELEKEIITYRDCWDMHYAPEKIGVCEKCDFKPFPDRPSDVAKVHVKRPCPIGTLRKRTVDENGITIRIFDPSKQKQ
ncbi:MAG: hypothetical protein NWE93_11330 [Candidatus Bathyarchaeota archaeon]|nr:hypothetical protein [Candidatus Bathyarchaeota archaeon]